jgi:hypothetical protein
MSATDRGGGPRIPPDCTGAPVRQDLHRIGTELFTPPAARDSSAMAGEQLPSAASAGASHPSADPSASDKASRLTHAPQGLRGLAYAQQCLHHRSVRLRLPQGPSPRAGFDASACSSRRQPPRMAAHSSSRSWARTDAPVAMRASWWVAAASMPRESRWTPRFRPRDTSPPRPSGRGCAQTGAAQG